MSWRIMWLDKTFNWPYIVEGTNHELTDAVSCIHASLNTTENKAEYWMASSLQEILLLYVALSFDSFPFSPHSS